MTPGSFDLLANIAARFYLVLACCSPRPDVAIYLSPQLPRALPILTQELSINVPICGAEHSAPARLAALQLLLLRTCGHAI